MWPRPASTVLRNVQMIADMEAESSSKRSALDKLSDRVSAFAGSSSLLLIHLAWFVRIARRRAAMAPTAFAFSTFQVALAAMVLTAFVLNSQNDLEGQARRPAAVDLQINVVAEREMTSVLRKVAAIASHLGVED